MIGVRRFGTHASLPLDQTIRAEYLIALVTSYHHFFLKVTTQHAYSSHIPAWGIKVLNSLQYRTMLVFKTLASHCLSTCL